MKITDECKRKLSELLSLNNADTLIISTSNSTEKGFTMNLDIGQRNEQPRVIEVNGIFIAISMEDENELEDIVFDSDGKQILIQQETHCCSCHGDCSCGCEKQEEKGCHCHQER